jgi:hypothetical protein
MRPKGISIMLVFFFIMSPTQKSGSRTTEDQEDALSDACSERIEVPLGPENPKANFAFVVEKPPTAKIPTRHAARLFSETVRAVTSVISPDHHLHLFLTLRLGQKRDYVTVPGNEGITVIEMRKWNDVRFVEMLARAIPGSVLSESELDHATHRALRRVHATVSVGELQDR